MSTWGLPFHACFLSCSYSRCLWVNGFFKKITLLRYNLNAIKFICFKCIIQWFLFIKLCSYCHGPVLEYFHCLRKIPQVLLQSPSSSLSPSPWQPLTCFLCSWNLGFVLIEGTQMHVGVSSQAGLQIPHPPCVFPPYAKLARKPQLTIPSKDYW